MTVKSLKKDVSHTRQCGGPGCSRRSSVVGPGNEEEQSKKQENADLGMDLESVMKTMIDWDELKYPEWHR